MTRTEALGSTGTTGAAGHPRRTPGAPCWVSLLVQDLPAAERFYGALFGWEFRPQPTNSLLGRSARALLDGREVAGLGEQVPGRHLPASWTGYLACDDVDITAERVRHRGGTVGVGPLDLPTAERLAVAADPSGAVFGILPSDARDTGPHRVPGTSVWTELVTYDVARTARFYCEVFGHVPRADVPTAQNRLTLHLPDGPVASVCGMQALPPDRGSQWVTCFGAADVDAAAARTIALGGSVLVPPSDGARGRTATVADPEGALFRFVETPG